MILKTPSVRSDLRRLLTVAAVTFSVPFYSQQFNFNTFTPIQCKGNVPGYFRMSLQKQQESFTRLLEEGKDEKAQKVVLGRINRGNYSLLNEFANGKILFGDDLTRYVNGVAEHIVKSNPSLPGDLQIFVRRAPDVNAGTYAMGVVLVNVGLLAHVRNEAELAAVLCHEIAHYTMKHNVVAAYDHYDDSKRKKSRRQDYGEFVQERLDRQFNRSKQHEFEADSMGLLYYMNTGYEGKAALSMFHMLHNSDNSYGNVPVSADYFTLGNVRLPTGFWLEEIKTSAPFQEHSDRYYTHPNAGARLERVTTQFRKLGLKDAGLAFRTVTSDQFFLLQDAARFEQIRLQLSSRQYGDVIYNAFVLSQKFPSSRYLDVSAAKAFYGLARYKNADEYSEVAQSYTQVEGEGQRVHYLLKQFNRKQLNAYALKLVIATSRKYPQERFLDSLKADLVKDMVVVNELKLDAFEGASAKKEDLHVALLADEVKDPSLRKLFENSYALLEKKKADDVRSASEREKEKAAKAKDLKRNGPGIRAQKVLIESPYVARTDKEGELLPEESEMLRTNVLTALQAVAAKTNLTCAPVRETMGKEEAAAYNRVALLNECIREYNAHGSLAFRPLVSDQVWPVAEDCKTPLVYFTTCRYDQGTRKHRYSSALYNLLTCRVVHQRLEYDSGEPSLKSLQSYIQEDFETIKR